MHYESCQEFFDVKTYTNPISQNNTLFEDHLHFYVGNNNIKFGVFSVDKKVLKDGYYKTILAEITLRKGVCLEFGNNNVIKLEDNYKFHIASNILVKVEEQAPPNSIWPVYNPTSFHICNGIGGNSDPSTMKSIGDFMCARPVLISGTTKTDFTKNTSNYTPLVISLNHEERQGRNRKLKFNKYFFIVCYGPYNQIMLCAIRKTSKKYTDYINLVEGFHKDGESLAVAINDKGTPSDYMEVNVHFKHALFSVDGNGNIVKKLLSVRRG